MSLLEPPDAPQGTAIEEPPALPVAPVVTGAVIRDVCDACKRPLMNMGDNRWVHLNASIDDTQNPAWHLPVLYVEPPVRWGFLNTDNRGSFEVDPKNQWRQG